MLDRKIDARTPETPKAKKTKGRSLKALTESPVQSQGAKAAKNSNSTEHSLLFLGGRVGVRPRGSAWISWPPLPTSMRA